MDHEGTPPLFKALGLPEGSSLLLDSSALIPLLEADDCRHRALCALFDAAGEGRCRLFASAIAWTELLRKPLSPGLEPKWRQALSDSGNIVIIPIDVAVADLAAELLRKAAARGGKVPGLTDALHVASALVAGADALLTADRGWKDLAPPALRVVELEYFAASFCGI